MMQREGWGRWIEHDGQEIPLPPSTFVRIRGEGEPGRFMCADGYVSEFLPMIWFHEFWGYQITTGKVAKCVAYRIRRPPGLQVLDEILAHVETEAPREIVPAGGGLPVFCISPAKTPAGGAVPPHWAYGLRASCAAQTER